jgi:hypothetical protein
MHSSLGETEAVQGLAAPRLTDVTSQSLTQKWRAQRIDVLRLMVSPRRRMVVRAGTLKIVPSLRLRINVYLTLNLQLIAQRVFSWLGLTAVV